MKTLEMDENVVGKNLQQIKVSVKKENSLVYSELWLSFSWHIYPVSFLLIELQKVSEMNLSSGP
jgi:hypothetical protein